jgi:HK97 gp10 family phage protein
MANVSVERFKRLTEQLRQEVRDAAIAELNSQAGELANLISQVAPREEGALAHSVRVIPGAKPTQVRVVAGGKATIRPSTSSKPYDYARADEFGTQKMPPRPFFFPTYRLRKKKIIAAMKRRIKANIKKRSAE